MSRSLSRRRPPSLQQMGPAICELISESQEDEVKEVVILLENGSDVEQQKENVSTSRYMPWFTDHIRHRLSRDMLTMICRSTRPTGTKPVT